MRGMGWRIVRVLYEFVQNTGKGWNKTLSDTPKATNKKCVKVNEEKRNRPESKGERTFI